VGRPKEEIMANVKFKKYRCTHCGARVKRSSMAAENKDKFCLTFHCGRVAGQDDEGKFEVKPCPSK
jgi:hypothetical protein